MRKPLNPGLFELLRAEFGSVRIQSEGVPVRYNTFVNERGFKEYSVTVSGEQYCVCCPFCGDKRNRLNVSHAFMQRTDTGVLMKREAHCFNEECKEALPALRGLVENGGDLGKIELSRSGERAPTVDEVAAECLANVEKLQYIPLSALPETHPAKQYLVDRGFDPMIYAGLYGLGYVASHKSTAISRRIYIPVTYGGVTIGWQMRAIPGFSTSETPKYMTAPGYRKSFFLYGLDTARKFNGCALVEGVTKAWRVGACACAVLGKSMSPSQLALLLDVWTHATGPIICISDPDSRDEWEAIAENIRQHLADKTRVITYHPQMDVGNMDQNYVWSELNGVCNAKGHAVPAYIQ